ncbi:MAG: c-type cytochrome [Gammaproteobacteria bacterium]|nr:c-type cytochrome [Gammaproteobacteria bacterium]
MIKMRKLFLSSIIFIASYCGASICFAQAKGEQLAWGCFSCHGVNGESQGPATPIIAGISKNYLIGAMLSYKYSDDLDKAVDIVEKNDDLEDVRIMKRYSAMMQRIAKAYSLDEIRELANYFSAKKFSRPEQTFDKNLASAGKKIHKKYCDKCHEDWGTSTEDDVGLLAGQWRTYLQYTLGDFKAGEREIPKKMKKKLKKLLKSHGDEGVQALIEFYSSQR